MTKIFAKKCFQANTLLFNQIVAVENGRITSVSDFTNQDYEREVELITPAFIDLQVNGGGGVMYNSTPTPQGLIDILEAHQRLGTSAILPTFITDTADQMRKAIDAMLEVWGKPGILGIHLEGPHINIEKKGTHNANFIRPFDSETFAQIQRLREASIPVMLTLAPELMEHSELSALKELGVIISAGHSMATFDQARTAFKHGVSVSTHLYNAMPAPSSRAPGLAMATILEGQFFGFIADGIHVSYPMIELAFRARENGEGMFIVSDAMSTVGGPDNFEIYGQKITVKDGMLINSEGSLAGAHIDMLTSVKNLSEQTSIPLDSILKMATATPMKAMKLPYSGELNGLVHGEWLALDDKFKLHQI